jgi:hypothetical protein
MTHDIPDLLQRMMQALPGNQTQIAARLSTRALKVPQPQVSRWINGQKPDVPAYERIVSVAVELGVLPSPDSDLDDAELIRGLRAADPAKKAAIAVLLGIRSAAEEYPEQHASSRARPASKRK